MAKQQRRIPPELKRSLVAEAGGKCANPGCSSWRTHIHHIKHWAVYKTHDGAHMIALCPSCHDAAHHGSLQVTDECLYAWKGVERPTEPDAAHIYVEPAKDLKLLLGSIAIASSNDQFVVFQLSNANELKMTAVDGEWLQVTTRLRNARGKEVLRVVQNNVRVHRDKDVTFEHRTGRVRITVLANEEYIPTEVLQTMRVAFPDFGSDGRLVALDLEVLKPGLVRVEGFWVGKNAVVITRDALCFCRPGENEPLCMLGSGEDSVINYTGPVTDAFLGLK